MFRSITALAGAVLLLAGSVAAAQSAKPSPVVAAGPAPTVPWCPPGQAKNAAGKCAPAAKPAETPTVYQTVGGVRTAVAGPGAAAPPPVAARPVAPMPVPAAKPSATAYAKPPAATRPAAAIPAAKPPRFDIAVGEPNGDCTSQAPNLIHDSRSPGGCAPCPRGRVPNTARQACVIPIPHRS